MEMPVLQGSSQHSTAMKDAFQQWVDKLRSNDTFAEQLITQLAAEAFSKQTHSAKTASSKFEQMWAGYHRFSCSTRLKELWMSALKSAPGEPFLPHFTQFITRKVMEEAVAIVFPLQNPDADVLQQTLKADDEQALRYVAGYVPMVLRRKYLKQADNPVAITYLKCLTTMKDGNEEHGSDVHDFLGYTKEWIEKVNRGGLFLINNNTYLLFRAMEMAVRRVLTTESLGKQPKLEIMKTIKASVLNDPTVMTCWDSILTDCPVMESSTSDNLLDEITEKWATIRGHSFANGWMELYQEAKRESKKQKGLRKQLQQKSSVQT